MNYHSHKRPILHNKSSNFAKQFDCIDKGMLPTFDSIAWSMDIMRNGQLVVSAWNLGDGGCNYYRWHDPHAELEFTVKANELYPHGLPPIDDLVLDIYLNSYGEGYESTDYEETF